jgi:hypothetical protein
MDEVFVYTQDPGHGWVAVPKVMLTELGIADKISSCSYMRGDVVYLEEDQDVTTWGRAFEERYGHRPVLREKFVESTRIRQYAFYQEESE